MKNPILLISVFILSMISFDIMTVFGQNELNLPTGVKMSSNGTFIPINDYGIDNCSSENGRFLAKYKIGAVTDENREIIQFKLFEKDQLLFSLKELPGSDIMISNSGLTAVFNMRFIYKNEVSLILYNKNGQVIFEDTYSYASLFGFSPSGNKLVIGTDKQLNIFDFTNNKSWAVPSCSKIAFSMEEEFLLTAREGKLSLFKDFVLVHDIRTDLFYPRALAIDAVNELIVVAGKSKIKAYNMKYGLLHFEDTAPDQSSFRDVIVHKNRVLAGVHEKKDGISKGKLHTYGYAGELLSTETLAEKTFKTFEKKFTSTKSTELYDPIPWPFDPFNSVHKVWNHYEQHMGDGSGNWSYLHQGLDIEVPINEPTYAVQAGWVKLVLTIGGESYWRVAISPEQSSGFSDGWLYAHIVQSTIQVDVGDYVEVHDYLGDIIFWSSDWGHIHFVNIHDQGDIWYYDDGEWGINFNPLLALDPITDESAPVIEEFSASSKFGFCENETSNYLSPDELSGEVDIIAKISDYHGASEWEQPAYLTYYWFKKYPEGDLVFPKTLGQILNHTYEMYNGGYYEAYAPLMYKKDFAHPSPPWMNIDRDYFQILTNNNGDSIAEPWEADLAFNTAAYYDGTYRLFIEAWDEYGNSAIDSQLVEFVNDNINGIHIAGHKNQPTISPNPVKDQLIVKSGSLDLVRIAVFNSNMQLILSFEAGDFDLNKAVFPLNVSLLKTGIYFVVLEGNKEKTIQKFIKI